MPIYPQRGLHGQVVRAVGQRIVRGDLRPGEGIDVEALEREFGVSRTVVRESLRVLAAKGLVDARPRRGTFVRDRSDWSLLDPDLLHWRYEGRLDEGFLDNLAEVRAIVEPAGARLAALRCDPDDLAALTNAMEGMRRAGEDDRQVIASDVGFHRALLGSSHNELLERMEVIIEVGMQALDRMVCRVQNFRNSLPGHQAVLDAVTAGNPDHAEAAMRALLDQAWQDIRAVSRGDTGSAESADPPGPPPRQRNG
ncbi:MAG TPA: FadR/GntR family transcriptional regulator [Mycobacteriales bacterium]|nr:FadR/GntR family transcriptional regulator [Mycobacteriales bacterium]